MDNRGQVTMQGLAISALVFIIVLTIYGQVYSVLNLSTFSSAVTTILPMIPLALVGALVIRIINSAF